MRHPVRKNPRTNDHDIDDIEDKRRSFGRIKGITSNATLVRLSVVTHSKYKRKKKCNMVTYYGCSESPGESADVLRVFAFVLGCQRSCQIAWRKLKLRITHQSNIIWMRSCNVGCHNCKKLTNQPTNWSSGVCTENAGLTVPALNVPSERIKVCDIGFFDGILALCFLREHYALLLKLTICHSIM